MRVLALDRSEVRPLLNHVGLCLTVAGSLGFIAGVAPSWLAQGMIAVIWIASCFAILWCSPDGPDRWRPFIVSPRVTEAIFGGAGAVIVLGGLAAILAVWLR